MTKVNLFQKRSARSGTMTISMCILLCAIAHSLFSQVLESNDYEKGYVKDGLKYSVWEYFNANKELELKINHTSGKIYFIKPDTSAFVIFKDDKWTEEKLIVYPIPVEGYHYFSRKLRQNIRYPLRARREGIEGTVCVMFDVDTTGTPTDFTIVKDIGGDTGQAVLRLLKEIQTPWIPAQIGRTK